MLSYACSLSFIKTQRRLITVFVLLAICRLIYVRFFVMPKIIPHQGDGHFQDISRRLGPFAVPGFSIKMPQFDLADPMEAEYHLTKLPSINRRCGLYLAFGIDDDTWERKLRRNYRATVRLQLRDSSGRTLVDLDGNVSDYTAYSSNRMNFIALYPRDKNTVFYPDPNENYIVKFMFKPENNKLKNYQGFVYIECGGHK